MPTFILTVEVEADSAEAACEKVDPQWDQVLGCYPEPKDFWGEDPAFPKKDWQYDVANGDAVVGYWDWVQQARDLAEY